MSESSESSIYEDDEPIFRSKLQKLYHLVDLTKSAINSGIYAATGIKLSQKKLIVSFLFTLIRDFVLAYSVRGSLKLIPKLIKMIQNLKLDLRQVLMQSFGLDTVKFGLFISLFFSSYKVSEKILSHWNFSKSANSLLSGGLASLSFLVMSGEEVEFRWTLAQYVAVRALQCLYNHIIRLYPQYKPLCYFGDVGLFALSSAQLLYGYFVRPSSLDPDYRNFVERLTCTPRTIVEANRQFLHGNRGRLEGSDLLDLALTVEKLSEALINHSHITALPCSVLHFSEACPERVFNVFSLVFKQAFPMYFSLHLIPRFLFKSQIQNLFEEIVHAAKNALQSSSFLAACGSIFQSFLCTLRWKELFQDCKYYYWLIGLVAGLGILIEKKHRRSELALYVLPKALQALYRLMLNRNLMIKIPRGEYLLFSLSISVLMNYYRKEPESMTPLVSRIFKRFL